MHRREFSKPSIMHPLHSLNKVRDTASLSPGLKNTFRSIDRIRQPLASINSDATKFLTVDILSGFSSKNRSGRVPTIPGRNQDGIDIATIKHLTKIAIEFAILIPKKTIDKGFPGITTGSLDIRNGYTVTWASSPCSLPERAITSLVEAVRISI
jgi:hypothetical protein